MRGAASLCLVLVVVAEMFVGGDGGLGRVIQDRRYSDDIPTLYGAIVVSGFVGYMMNLAFIAAEARVARFMGKS
jgi:NitT/TauT family transport system permease protein